jgi:VCBS repeat-containing protein
VAVADSYTVVEDGALSRNAAGGVLSNDIDLEGNPLTAALALGPTHGQLTFNPDGSFTYTPNANFFGTDTFSYQAKDANTSQPATVTIQVTAVNDAPVAVNDTVVVSEDSSITYSGIPPQGFTPVQWTANGHYYAQVRGPINWPDAKAAAESLRYQGAKGHLVTVTSEAEHKFLVASVLTGSAQRYWIGLTDEGTEGNFRWLTGEPFSFNNWGQGQPDNARGEEHYGEVVQVSGTPLWLWNDIYPSFGTNGYVVEFEGPFNKGVLENDVEVDSDALMASLVSGPSNGKLQFNVDGTFTYTPNPNFSGIDSFSYKASDGQLESNVATVTLNVVAGNDPPVAVADSYFVADKLTVSAASGVLANDTDVDTPKANLVAQLVSPPSAGTLTLNANGSFTYTRGLNFSGSDTFTYRTGDGSAFSAPVIVTIAAALRLRTENVTIVSQPQAPVEGFFDVFVEVAPGFDFSSAGYDVALRTPAGSGITLVSAAAPSAAHPSLFATQPTFVVSGGALRVTDALATGSADVDNGDGLFRVRFTVAPETVGDVPLSFTTAFTNLADENGNPLPIDRVGGIIAVTEPPAPNITSILVRSSEWSNPFVNSIHPQGLGHVVPAGAGQLTDLPWTNVDQIVVRFNEHVSVQQADLLVHGVNNATYAISGFSYNPATFTATWTLEDPLPADKVRIQLAAGGADPIRNAAGVRLDGDWSDGTSAYPSGNGKSGGDFQFRFDVLPGNVDQIGPVNIFDTIKTRNRQFTTVGDANYSALYDVNGSGDINIFDTVQVRNHQFTSLPEGEPAGGPAPAPPLASLPEHTLAPAPPAVMIRTENVTITSQSSAAVEGVFDVYVDVIAGASVSVAGYDVALRTPAGSGVTLVSAGLSSAAHPALFTSEPTDFVSQNMLGVTDALPTGATPLDHNDGLFSVRFSVAPGAVGSVPLMFNTAFTNLADAQGNPIAVGVEPGVITITSPPITITGTSGNDTYHVLRSGSQLRIYENTAPVGQPTYTVDLAAMPSAVVINAGDGNDTLTVDPGAQTALGLHRLIYNAGTGANALVLASGSARIDSTATGGTLGTTVAAGAQLSTAQLRQNELSLASNSRVTLMPDGEASVITSLALGAGATLDLGNNALVVDYVGASPLATIRQQILAGRGGSGLGASWNGTGITSSAVAQANQADAESRSVGYAENSLLPLGPYTTFRGVPVDNTAVLIAYARTADANLDGVVNDDDVTVVGATYAPGAANANWSAGDFDFNGFVDDDDVTLLGVFYDPSAGAPTPIGRVVSSGVVSGEWSRVDHDLVDLLAESITTENEPQSLSLSESNQAGGRRSPILDNVWEHWEFAAHTMPPAPKG